MSGLALQPRNQLAAVAKRIVLFCLAIIASNCLLADQGSKLQVRGIDGDLRRNFLLHLGPVAPEQLAQPGRLKTMIDRALERGLQPYGYYQAQASSQIENGALRLEISPGPRIHFVRPDLRVSGAVGEVKAIAKLLAKAPIVEGEALRYKAYEATKSQLLLLARDHGFMEASWQRSRLEVNLDTQSALAELWLDGGPRYRFGEVIFDSHRIDEDVLRRLLQIVPGEPYLRGEVTRLTRKLQDTGYFEHVDVLSTTGESQQVNLQVQLDDASKHRFDIGTGFSTDSNLRARLDWIQPAINRRGHSQRSEIFVSAPRSRINSTYRIPGEHPLHDSFEIGIGFETREIKDNPVDSGTVGAHFTTLDQSGWQWSWGGNVSYEDYRVSDQDAAETFYASPDVSATRLRLETGRDPRRGLRISLGAEGSHESLGADTDYLRLFGLGQWLMPVANTRMNLHLRGELGAIITADIHKVPLTRRFFTGGDQSVRGYGFEAISPRDAEGNLEGGKYLNVGSVEISQLVKPSWRVALFSDVGRAYTDHDERWRRSIGIGLRWLTPFGQLRIDLAAPLNDSDADTVRLHFTLGASL